MSPNVKLNLKVECELYNTGFRLKRLYIFTITDSSFFPRLFLSTFFFRSLFPSSYIFPLHFNQHYKVEQRGKKLDKGKFLSAEEISRHCFYNLPIYYTTKWVAWNYDFDVKLKRYIFYYPNKGGYFFSSVEKIF